MGGCGCDPFWDDLGDRCAGTRCCSICAGFPAQWTSFLLSLLSTALVLAVSLYTFIRVRFSVFNFSSYSMPWLLFVNSGLLGIASAALLLLLAMLVWAAFSSDTLGYIFKFLFASALVLAIVGLALASVGSLYIAVGARGADTGWENELLDVWQKEVANEDRTLACEVQAKLRCEGYFEGDCLKRNGENAKENCATRCSREDREEGQSTFENVLRPSCGERMNGFFGDWFLINGIGTGVGCILTLINLIAVLGGVSFRKRKQRDVYY